LGRKEFHNLPEKFNISFSKFFDFLGNGSFQRARPIVATVLLRLLYLDPESVVCSAHGFKPWTELGGEFD
jgi:hypothetical protein